VSLTEQIESVQWLGQRFEFTGRPRLNAAMLMRWPQHEMRSVVVIARTKCGTEWCRDRDAALGVQPILVGAKKARHPYLVPFRPDAPLRQPVWDGMG